MAKAIWESTILAESDDIVVVEGNRYFPPEAIHWEYFKHNSQTTVCPWKGRNRCRHSAVSTAMAAAFSSNARPRKPASLVAI
jgi:uncharacterized protein (DUF427 family)